MSSETVLRSSGVYTTVLGALNQFQALTNMGYTSMSNTTLNFKYGNNNSSVLNREPDTIPALAYFGIGTRGFVNVGDYSSVAYPGDARLMDLYEPLPIRCVPVDEEATTLKKAERDNYRLRVVKNINGVDYALYYLKKIEFDSNISIVQKDTNGNETRFEFDVNQWLLNPQPPTINEVGGMINTNLNRIIVRATGVCTITHDEVMEAVRVLHNGDTNYARISEIGYYTGCDVFVDENWQYTESAEAAKYIEAIGVQLAKGHCFRGSELTTPNSKITPIVTLESESCMNSYV